MPVSGSAFILLAVLLAASLNGSLTTLEADASGGSGGTPAAPPDQAAAQITHDVGECLKFISVYAPAQDGRYAVGVSFAFRDMDHDGAYSPGTDKLEVCVNCEDTCGWGP